MQTHPLHLHFLSSKSPERTHWQLCGAFVYLTRERIRTRMLLARDVLTKSGDDVWTIRQLGLERDLVRNERSMCQRTYYLPISEGCKR